MIFRGIYKVKGIICISKSLLSQKSTKKDPAVGDIHKGVLEKDGSKFIVYFLDDIDFGKDSVISIPVDSKKLLYRDEYTVVEKGRYKVNQRLIRNLL